MAKKWYSFFVVSNSPEDEAVEAPRIADIAAETAVAFDKPVADTATHDDIYSAARIATPPHGYTILKVAEMLESEHIRELPADVRRKSVLVALDAAGVSVKEIVEDAVQRDRALDTYERVLEQNLEALRVTSAEENTALEAEVEQRLRDLRAAIDKNNQAVAQAREQLAVWRAGKRAEETRIADAVGYFVSENPISRADGAQGGITDVR
jgi:Asp-tRNA(Asn)/Glu-tRNA(Gln) amidotransferase A subunit family amidase